MVTKFRETPMTKPEPRFYKETPPVSKNISHLHGAYKLHEHVAPNPEKPFKDHQIKQKQEAYMQVSNVFYSDEKAKPDSPTKKLHPASQMISSDLLYADKHERSECKKGTHNKTKEIVGSGVVQPLSYEQLQVQDLKYGRQTRDVAIEGCLGSKGATDAIKGYRDNDVTFHLVNAK